MEQLWGIQLTTGQWVTSKMGKGDAYEAAEFATREAAEMAYNAVPLAYGVLTIRPLAGPCQVCGERRAEDDGRCTWCLAPHGSENKY